MTTSPASGALPADTRAQFEHWWSDESRHPNAIKRGYGDFYASKLTQEAWFAWRACAAALASREAPAQPSPAPLTKVLAALANEWERESAAKGVRDEPNARGQALAYRICAGDLRGRLESLAPPQVAPAPGTHLTNAAPDLLAALQVVVADWTAQFERNGHRAPAWCKQARDAIAKATGEQA